MSRLLISVLALLAMAGIASAQINVNDLSDEINSGRIKLVSTTGNGSSSGASVEGYLINEATTERRVDINLSRPIYLVNSGIGQNMVASQVYLSDGGYQSDGRRSFITLQPKAQTRVLFIAYCVDFDRANPSERDNFSIGAMPVNLNSVMSKINAYHTANPDADVTVAAQVAIWLAQGGRIAEIQSKFPFTPADERLARNFIE